MTRIILAVAALCLLALWQHAKAADLTFLSAPCPVVRQLVRAAGGLDTAIDQAKQRGYSEQQIEAVVKRCNLRG